MNNYKRVLKVKWDPESPRFKTACFKLGIDTDKLKIK